MGYLGFTIAKTMIFGLDVPGYASLLSVILFFNGVLLVGIGVIGEYLARIFTEVKARPLYIVSETIGMEPGVSASVTPELQRRDAV